MAECFLKVQIGGMSFPFTLQVCVCIFVCAHIYIYIVQNVYSTYVYVCIYSLCKCSKKVIAFPSPFSSCGLGSRLSEVCFGLTVRVTVFPVALGMLTLELLC